MDNNSEDFEKKFSEMLETDDLKEISNAFKSDIQISLKEVYYTMQFLVESLEHLTSLMLTAQDNPEEALSTLNNPDIKDFFNHMSESSENFNDSIVEYIIENDILQAGIDFIEDLEDEEEDDDK
jgi:hypothetical protein